MTTYADAPSPRPDGFCSDDMLLAACRDAAAAVHVDGSAISAAGNGSLFLLAATDDAYERLERTQHFYAAGSIVEAWSSARPVAVASLVDQASRWPEFCHLAGRLDVVSVLSVPISAAGAIKGVLSCYSTTRRSWTSRELSCVQRVAARLWRGGGRPADVGRLTGLVDGADALRQACGILAREMHVSEAAAAGVLKRFAEHAGMTQTAVAAALVRRELAGGRRRQN